jgi:hypothetical protein
VQKGLAIADKFKDDTRYDHQWPSAYGLERMMCAMGGECSPPSAMPKAQWGDAWEETKAHVTRYYRINPPPASAPASAPPTATPRHAAFPPTQRPVSGHVSGSARASGSEFPDTRQDISGGRLRQLGGL